MSDNTENLPSFQTRRKAPDLLPPTTAETFSKNTDDGSHLDAIRMPDLEDQGHDPDAPITLDEDGNPIDDAPPQQITQEAFWVVFQTAFNLPGQMVPMLAPMGITPEQEQPARAASDATYSLLEIYYPSALMPQSETLAHVLVAAPFFIAKVMVVREIIRASRAKPVPQPEEKRQDQPAKAPEKPANDWHLEGQASQ